MSIGYALLNIDKDGTPSTKLGPKMGMEARSLTSKVGPKSCMSQATKLSWERSFFEDSID